MRNYKIFKIFIVVLLFLPLPASGKVESLYVETIEGYHRINGETLRWESEREFAIQSYSFFSLNETSFVNMSVVDDSQYGLPSITIEEMRKVNFVPEIKLLENGSIVNVNWEIFLFRIPHSFSNPFDTENADIFYNSNLGHRRYDQYVESEYFSLALEHYEFHLINGKLVKLKVNSEFQTDNYVDGRSFKTSLHIIKRAPDGEILFDYNYSFYEVNDLRELLNLIDQPIFWVPIRLAPFFLTVYFYKRIGSWWKKAGYKVLKTDMETEDENIQDNSN